jgi:hypothetical protein
MERKRDSEEEGREESNGKISAKGKEGKEEVLEGRYLKE